MAALARTELALARNLDPAAQRTTYDYRGTVFHLRRLSFLRQYLPDAYVAEQLSTFPEYPSWADGLVQQLRTVGELNAVVERVDSALGRFVGEGALAEYLDRLPREEQEEVLRALEKFYRAWNARFWMDGDALKKS